jgi:hypothetical protein
VEEVSNLRWPSGVDRKERELGLEEVSGRLGDLSNLAFGESTWFVKAALKYGTLI